MGKKAETREWIKDFQAAGKRPFRLHVDNSFIHTYKPVLDDAPYRTFGTLREYRRWCEQKLPKWLGYGRSL